MLWGRDDELREVRQLVENIDGTDGARALVILGEPGIGKSSLWSTAVNSARRAGARVRTTTGVQVESEMPYVGLEDLLGDVLDELGAALPGPQREALSGAFLRTRTTADNRTVAAGVVTLLGQALDEGPVVLAADDVQWMDPETHSCLAHAVRRLARRPLVLLLAAREASPLWWQPHTPGDVISPILQPVREDRVTTIRLGPMSEAAIGALLRDRFDPAVLTTRVDQITAETGGNPLWAVEFARDDHGGHPSGPQALRTLVADRVADLKPDVTGAACLVAALGRPQAATVLSAIAAGPDSSPEELIDQAADLGLVRVVDSRIVPAHPLIGAALLAGLPTFQRRRLYRLAADVAETDEARALHLLRATADTGVLGEGASLRGGELDELVRALDEASLVARRRGAVGTAARFASRALDLVAPHPPPSGHAGIQGAEDHGSATRAVDIAELCHQAGQPDELLAVLNRLDLADLNQDLLERAAPLLAGTLHLRQGQASAQAVVEAIEKLPVADLSSADLLRRQALISTMRADTGCGAIRDRRRHARRAVEQAERSEAPVALRRRALITLVTATLENGEPVDDIVRRLEHLDVPTGSVPNGADTELIEGMRLWGVLDLTAARASFSATMARHLIRGDERTATYAGDMLAYIDLLSGHPESAEATLAYLEDHTARPRRDLPYVVNTLAMLHLVRGEHDTLQELLDHWVREDQSARAAVFSARLYGLLAAQREDPGQAVPHLARAVQIAETHGVSDPHRRLDTDVALAEALISTGEHTRAEQVIDVLDRWAPRTDRNSTRGQGLRLRAVLAAQRDRDLDRALFLAHTAVALHADGPIPAEHASSLVALAEIHELRREPVAARERRGEAHTVFCRIGHTWWAQRTAYSPAVTYDGLTLAERGVAGLVADGATNRLVAESLHLSVRTVENHLTSVYRKLGIRSRAQLPGRLTLRN